MAGGRRGAHQHKVRPHSDSGSTAGVASAFLPPPPSYPCREEPSPVLTSVPGTLCHTKACGRSFLLVFISYC